MGTLLGLAETTVFVSVFTAAAGWSFTIGAACDVSFVLSTEIVFLKGALSAEITFPAEIFFSKDPSGSEETFSLALLAFISDNLAA